MKDYTPSEELLAAKEEIRQLQEELAALRKAAMEERQQAQQQVETLLSLLYATLEACDDGIIAIQNSQHIVACNQKFIEMWNIPAFIIASRDLNLVLPLMKEQLKEPEVFEERAKFFQTNAESYGIFDLKDGEILECYSHPCSVGIVCSFRNITIALNLGESEERYRVLKELMALEEPPA